MRDHLRCVRERGGGLLALCFHAVCWSAGIVVSPSPYTISMEPGEASSVLERIGLFLPRHQSGLSFLLYSKKKSILSVLSLVLGLVCVWVEAAFVLCAGNHFSSLFCLVISSVSVCLLQPPLVCLCVCGLFEERVKSMYVCTVCCQSVLLCLYSGLQQFCKKINANFHACAKFPI